MDDLLLNLEIPSLQESFDIFAPAELKIGQLAEILANGISDLTNGRYSISGREMLMLRKPDVLLNPEKSLKDYNIREGSILMLL